MAKKKKPAGKSKKTSEPTPLEWALAMRDEAFKHLARLRKEKKEKSKPNTP